MARAERHAGDSRFIGGNDLRQNVGVVEVRLEHTGFKFIDPELCDEDRGLP